MNRNRPNFAEDLKTETIMLNRHLSKVMTSFGVTLFVSLSAFATGPATSIAQRPSDTSLGQKRPFEVIQLIDKRKLNVSDLFKADGINPNRPLDLNGNDKKASKGFNLGGDGSGGGNTINGKIIEKYRVDITQAPEYKTFVIPVLGKLKKLYAQFGQNLEKIATKKTWYMIPVPFKTLPPKVVGLGHLDLRNVDYKQPSIQTLFSVWTDQNNYNQLGGPREKAEHILHELALGLYENEFETNLAQAEDKARTIAAALLNITSDTTAEQFESSLDLKKLGIYLSANHEMDYPAKLDAEQIYMLIYEIKKIHGDQSCYSATYSQADKTVTVLCNGQKLMTVKGMKYTGKSNEGSDAEYQAEPEIIGDPNQSGAVQKIAWFSTNKFVSIKNLSVSTFISELRYDVANKKSYIEWRWVSSNEPPQK